MVDTEHHRRRPPKIPETLVAAWQRLHEKVDISEELICPVHQKFPGANTIVWTTICRVSDALVTYARPFAIFFRDG
jgi:hypothetical protein